MNFMKKSAHRVTTSNPVFVLASLFLLLPLCHLGAAEAKSKPATGSKTATESKTTTESKPATESKPETESKPVNNPVPVATPIQAPDSKIEWDEPQSALPTMPAPINWQIETYRDLRYKQAHTMKDGTVLMIDVVPFILTPANPKMVYFLEPGYNPKTGANQNLGKSINELTGAIDKTQVDLKAIATQLDKLREFLRE